jgi:hypothetical protein
MCSEPSGQNLQMFGGGRGERVLLELFMRELVLGFGSLSLEVDSGMEVEVAGMREMQV